MAVLSRNRAVTPERARVLKRNDWGLYTCQGIRQGLAGFPFLTGIYIIASLEQFCDIIKCPKI